MRNAVLYTVIVIGYYHLSFELLEYLLLTEKVADIFLSFNKTYWSLLLYSIIYLFLVGIALIFIKLYGVKRYPIIKVEKNIQTIAYLFLFVLLIRIIEDPFYRINMIMGDSIPVLNTNSETPFMELLSVIIGTVLLGPVYEELLFRRIILNFYDKKYIAVGIVLSSLFFALIHFNQSFSNHISIFLKFIFGVIASLIYIRKGLFYSILFHVSYNFLWLIINENEKIYWSLIHKLHFGVWYWTIVLVSFGLILYLGIIKLDIFKRKLVAQSL